LLFLRGSIPSPSVEQLIHTQKLTNPQTATTTISGEELWQWCSQIRQQFLALNMAESLSLAEFNTELAYLLETVAGLDRLSLKLQTYRQYPQLRLSKSLTELNQLWRDRWHKRIPLQYLLGVAPWRNFLLKVSPAVLIPRPETEEIIDLALQSVDQNLIEQPQQWADLGTGSGAIALGLATVFPNATVHAVDCSSAALAIAKTNIQKYGFGGLPAKKDAEQMQPKQIYVYQGEWFSPFSALKDKLTGVVANPPYIPTGIISALQPEVAAHEPHLALDGGIDGLDCIREIIATAPDYLQTNGLLLLEIMIDQAGPVADLFKQQASYRDIQIQTDLSGVERFVLAYRV
jgi:release factor glutamine methyltransferase